MSGIIDQNTISFLISLIFSILAFVFGLRKHKGFFKILFYVISAYILGSTIYPGLSMMYYTFQNKTLMGESLDNYKIYFGLSGLLLIIIAGYGLYEILFKTSKKKKKRK